MLLFKGLPFNKPKNYAKILCITLEQTIPVNAPAVLANASNTSPLLPSAIQYCKNSIQPPTAIAATQ